ncbi:hypothetical protein N9Z79_04995, partial [Akkermansiaceae bacterium]|nr:hypothetical protein [Akkermansiaceae bacterium]MDB4383429.1 hypothetical protein [Akkermansiaceae bacterium]
YLFLSGLSLGETVQNFFKKEVSERMVFDELTLSEVTQILVAQVESELFPGNKIPFEINLPSSNTHRRSFILEPALLGESLSIIAANFDCTLIQSRHELGVDLVSDQSGCYLFNFHQPFRVGILENERGIDKLFADKNIKKTKKLHGCDAFKTTPQIYLDLIKVKKLWERGWFGNIQDHKKKAYPESIE